MKKKTKKPAKVWFTAEYLVKNHPELDFDELFSKAYGYSIADLPDAINKEVFRSTAVLPSLVI